MDEREALQYEHAEATALLRALGETRFKLLALVPTLSGAVVALTSAGQPAVELLALGLVGLAATTGALVYELRNGQLARVLAARVRGLERRLFGAGELVPEAGPLLTHALGVALVYGAAFAGWGYLVSWGALRAAGVGSSSREAGLVVGAAFGVLVAVAVVRLERGAAAAAAAAPAHAER
jgi:hypothetical protein